MYPSDYFLLSAMPAIMEYDATYQLLLLEYLGREGVSEEFLHSRSMQSKLDVFALYRHFLRVNAYFGIGSDANNAENPYNPLLITAPPLALLTPKLAHFPRLWIHGWSGLLVPSETICRYPDPSAYIAFFLANAGQHSREYLEPPPRILFRGQQQPTPFIISPMSRIVLHPAPRMRIQLLGWNCSLMRWLGEPFPMDERLGDLAKKLDRCTLHMSLNMRAGMQYMRIAEEGGPPTPLVVATPFHLVTSLFAPMDFRMAVCIAEDTAMDVCKQVLHSIPHDLVRSYVAHLTDYELPVPLVGPVGLLWDLVPNPFVSTTVNLKVAMLYGSGYVRHFQDKYNVNWGEVVRLCKEMPKDEGQIYVIRSRREAMPITRVAGPDTLGCAEGEYALPGAIFPDEVVSCIPLRAFADEVDIARLFQYVDSIRTGEPSVERQLDVLPDDFRRMYNLV